MRESPAWIDNYLESPPQAAQVVRVDVASEHSMLKFRSRSKGLLEVRMVTVKVVREIIRGNPPVAEINAKPRSV